MRGDLDSRLSASFAALVPEGRRTARVAGQARWIDISGRPSSGFRPAHAPRGPAPLVSRGLLEQALLASPPGWLVGPRYWTSPSLPRSAQFLIGHIFSRAAAAVTTTSATCSTVGLAHWPRVPTRPRPHPAPGFLLPPPIGYLSQHPSL